MERKTSKHLEYELSVMNAMTEQTFILEKAYSGWKLFNESQGVEITPYRLTAREMFYVLNAIKHTLDEERKHAKKTKKTNWYFKESHIDYYTAYFNVLTATGFCYKIQRVLEDNEGKNFFEVQSYDEEGEENAKSEFQNKEDFQILYNIWIKDLKDVTEDDEYFTSNM
jgi:hypothetical protein